LFVCLLHIYIYILSQNSLFNEQTLITQRKQEATFIVNDFLLVVLLMIAVVLNNAEKIQDMRLKTYSAVDIEFKVLQYDSQLYNILQKRSIRWN
jgi:hypothetical protein